MLFSFLLLVMCASDNSNPLLLQVFGSFGDHRAFMFFSLCVLLFGTAAQMHGFNADSNKAVQLFAQTFLVIGHLYITAAAAVQKSGQLLLVRRHLKTAIFFIGIFPLIIFTALFLPALL